jgi:Flp pilus assembly protein TadD
MSFRLIRLCTYIILFAVVLLVFLPSVQNDFVDWDDYGFVTKNPRLTTISFESLRWMTTTFYMGVWHPLTWFSHAVDISLWGENPSPHRLVNILIHCCNVVLFCLLCSTLQDIWTERNPGRQGISTEGKLIAAACAALLFGIHPLRVESVVWISERKDVLCSFFFLCSLLAYLSYARRDAPQRGNRLYFLSLGFHLAALLAKPMAITLPFVLLVVDYFPLYRLDRKRMWKCVREKIPYMVFSAGCIILNMAATWQGSVPFSYVPLRMRIMNAFHAIIFYIRQSFVPINLLPFYQMDRSLDYFGPEFLICAAIVAAISGFCIWRAVRGSRLWLALWCYFLVALAPALGLFMSYKHAMADRYTYLPTLGLWLLVGLALARLWLKCADFKHVVVPRIALVLCFVLVSAVYAERTREQSKVWRNTESLWAYVLNNADYIPDQAYGAMGKVLEKKGDLEGATKYYRAAFSLNPEDARFRGLLALALAKQGQNEDALALCEELVAKEPGSPMSYLQLGRVFLQLERYDEAVSSFKKSMEISPGYQYAAALLVATYLKMNKLAEARELYAKYKDKGVLVSPDIDVELGGKILDPAEKSP